MGIRALLQSFLKPKTHSNSYNYAKEYYYGKLVDQHKNLSSYENILNAIEAKTPLVSEQNIVFLNEELLADTNRRDIIQKFGAPRYSNTFNKHGLDIEILFYKIHIGKHRVRLTIHLFQGNLFYFSYTFSHINAEDKQETLNILQKKYISMDLDLNTTEYYIMDKHQSVILVEDHLDFRINYFSYTSNIIHMISGNNERQRSSSLQREKYMKKELYRKL